MSSAQVKERKLKSGRTGDTWSVYDPGCHYEDLMLLAVVKFESYLHPSEQSPQGLLKLLIENIDLAVLAIRPKPVAPAILGGEMDEEAANIVPAPTPVK